MENISIHLSDNIIRLRRKKGITQEELARFIGVTKASVSKWETGMSMPDILLLPVLAAFFDVTVDELLGYEPQLSREQIQAVYYDLASDFAEKPFEDVMAESETLVKKYYSCYPFLLYISVLWLNHFMLAKDQKRQQEILMMIERLCERILSECKNLLICNNASGIKAMAALCSGKAEEVIENLADIQDVNSMKDNASMLVQAYLMAGKLREADRAAQINMCWGIMTAFSSGTHLLTVYGNEPEKGRRVVKRMDALIKDFELDHLNPNAVASYEYQTAVMYAEYGEEATAFERLERYVRAVKILYEQEMRLHGDDFFYELDSWYENIELGKETVRNKKLIGQSVMSVFDHPVFQKLSDCKKLEKIKREAARICGIGEV